LNVHFVKDNKKNSSVENTNAVLSIWTRVELKLL